jgi:hypothetical protein
MCATTDADAQGNAVYQEVSPGQFTLIHGTGGLYTPDDLVALGVPAATANTLYNSIVQQELALN